MTRSLLLGCLLVGCGDPGPTTIQVSAPGARWIAVQPAPAEPWVRFDGEAATFEARGTYEVAVVCREDIGDGWSIRATPADPTEHAGVCRYPGGLIPQFAITGEVDAIFVGSSATHLPNIGTEIAPGTYDVVAQQRPAGQSQVTRVQILRDVVVDGATPIPIDVDAHGVAPGALALTIDGVAADAGYITGETARGTWFTFFGGFATVVPDALLVPGDRQIARLYRDDGWADVPVHEGAIDVTLPAEPFDVTYETSSGVPVARFAAAADWSLVRFRVSQWTSVGEYPPWWRVHVHRGALAEATSGGVTRIAMTTPDLAGWGAGWMPDVTAEHRWSLTTERDRADGGKEGLVGGGAVQASTSR